MPFCRSAYTWLVSWASRLRPSGFCGLAVSLVAHEEPGGPYFTSMAADQASGALAMACTACGVSPWLGPRDLSAAARPWPNVAMICWPALVSTVNRLAYCWAGLPPASSRCSVAARAATCGAAWL